MRAIILGAVMALLLGAMAAPAAAQNLDLGLVAGAGPAVLNMSGETSMGTVLAIGVGDEALVERAQRSGNALTKSGGYLMEYARIAIVQYGDQQIGGGVGIEQKLAPNVGAGVWWTSVAQAFETPLANSYVYWRVASF